VSKRRDIRKVDAKLKHTRYVLSVALYKFKSPAYWVDLYCSSSSNPGQPSQYWALVQWSFPRQDEVVEGHSDPINFVSRTQAAAWIESRVDRKIDDGWKYHSLDIQDAFDKSTIVDYVEESAKKWIKGKAATVSKPEPIQVANSPKIKTRKERFLELQKKRKAKAEW